MQGLGSQGAPTALRVAGLTGGPADTDKRRKQPTAARHLVHGGSAKQPAGPVAVPCPDTLKHQLEDVLTVLSSSSLKLILLGKEQAGSGWLSAPEEVRRLSQACPPQSLPSTRPDDHSACWGCCGVVLQITVQLDTVTFVQVTSPTTRPASPPEALMLAATQPNPAVNPGPVHSLSSSGAAGAAAGVNQTGGMAQPVVYPPVYQEDQIVSCPRCATRFKSPQACHSLICPECMLPIEENAGAGAQSPQLQPQQPPPQQPQQPPQQPQQQPQQQPPEAAQAPQDVRTIILNVQGRRFETTSDTILLSPLGGTHNPTPLSLLPSRCAPVVFCTCSAVCATLSCPQAPSAARRGTRPPASTCSSATP